MTGSATDIRFPAMNQTRREFIVTMVCSAGILPAAAPASSRQPAGGRRDGRLEGGATMLQGDPYLAFVDDAGLGGQSWEAARDHALRFRSTPEERDRYVLGLEI